MKREIYLGSASPRRRELCELIGFPFTVKVSNADENIAPCAPKDYVRQLAARKAGAVADELLRESSETVACGENSQETARLVIGSDTVVVLGDEILGKPKDEADAARMLQSLSGRTHQVYTGVCLIELIGDERREHTFYECTDVRFIDITDDEILAYIATGEPMDKAGAYAIQGRSAVFISGINGDYYNVVGLPITALRSKMKELSWL